VLSKTLIQALACAGLVLTLKAASNGAAEIECRFGCPNDGREYRDALATAIARADRIEVTEHSDPWDDYDLDANRSRIGAEILYAAVKLDAAQKRLFLDTVRGLDPKTQDWANACMPVVHHTVRFYDKDIIQSTMQICFHCSQVFWDGIKRKTNPESIHAGLEQFVTAIGLRTERDWEALAQEHLASHEGTSR